MRARSYFFLLAGGDENSWETPYYTVQEVWRKSSPELECEWTSLTFYGWVSLQGWTGSRRKAGLLTEVQYQLLTGGSGFLEDSKKARLLLGAVQLIHACSDRAGFKSWLYHLLAVWHWVRRLTSLSFSIVIWREEAITLSCQGSLRINEIMSVQGRVECLAHRMCFMITQSHQAVSLLKAGAMFLFGSQWFI